VHVERGDGHAKFWLDAVDLAYSTGLKAQEIRRARELVEQHAVRIREHGNEYFGA
jgi:hypothetical protein